MGILRPDRCVHSIDLVDVDGLVRGGVRCVLFDRDNTCVPRDTGTVPPAVAAWFCRVHEAGISTCMVSNNVHTREVKDSAREFASPVVHHALKPLPWAVRRALARMGVSAGEAVMVGDQVFTDVIAGNLAGVRTILVRPQSSCDLPHMRLLRSLERRVLGNRPFEGE